jgi:TonB-linked SusC/RagA family outer membrane protein
MRGLLTLAAFAGRLPPLLDLPGGDNMNLGRWRILAAAGAALTLLTGASRLSAQGGTITGRVTAQGTGQPLAEARVLVIGTTIAVSTSEDGKFTLKNVPAGAAQLQVLRVGFQSQKKSVTVAAGAAVNEDFVLGVAVAQLEEVVTTATGQQRKVELGNSISTLGDVGKRVEEVPTHNLSDLMIAKSPGVTILPGTELGGAPTIRIRGVSSISLSNAPIWYVDGVRYSSGSLNSGTDASFSLLNSINPEEIEDIEIVKGPSAATLYGTNAANGVIVITTKKGKAGTTRWNWSAEGRTVDDRVPYQDMYANFGKDSKGVVTRCQLATMTTSAFAGNCTSDSVTHYNYMKDPDRTFVHLGHGSLFGASVSGGTDAVRFFASGDLDNETGPIQMQGFEMARFDSAHVGVRDEWYHPSAQQRGSFRGNLSASLSPKFDLNISSGFSKLDNRIPPESDLIIALYYVGMQNYGYKGCPGGKFPCGLDKDPFQADGVPLNDALQWAPGDVMQVTQNSDVQRFTGSSTATWRPFAWMQNEGTAGLDLAAVDFFQLCRLTECPPQSATAKLGRVTDNQSTTRNFSAKISSTSTWNPRTWANLKTSFGGDYTNLEDDFANTNGTTLPPGASTVAAASTRNASQKQPTAAKTLGVYVQEQAGLRDRLFLTAALRTDQNSAFGSNFQQVYYPKVSASWIASDESFFPQFSWLNQFRLRGAYGASGVQPGATQGLITYSPATVALTGRNTTTEADQPGLTASQPGNANLKPERSAEFEGGFDSQLLSNKVHFEYTFWNKKTTDALVNITLAPSSTASQLSPLLNVGSTQGWGHEVQANAQLIDRRNFGWDLLVSGSHFSNKIVSLGGVSGLCQTSPNDASIKPVIVACLRTGTGGTSGEARQIPGHPINEQWYRGYTYADANHDGILQISEVHVDSGYSNFGYRVPRDIISIQNGVDLFQRRLRIQAMFDYKGGASILDGANNFQCNTGPFSCQDTQDPKVSLDRQAAAIAKTFGSVVGGTTYKTSSGYFRNNQFWKLREFSMTAQLPDMVTSRLRAQRGSTLVFGARNLHTWTNWIGVDPEANYGLTQSESQNEFQTTGAPTYFTLRLNLKY